MQIFSGIIISFFGLFIALDPIGLLPSALSPSISGKESKKKQVRLVYRALSIGLGLLIVCRIAAWFIGLLTVDFQIGGGIGLFMLSMCYLLKPDLKRKLELETINVFPLSVPLIVGPSVIIMILVLMSSYGLIITGLSFAANIFLVDLIFRKANKIQKSFGKKGVVLLSKAIDIFLSIFAIMLIRKGLIALFTQIYK
jgi:small neutral amino acid transporter SnatA (MarC family)